MRYLILIRNVFILVIVEYDDKIFGLIILSVIIVVSKFGGDILVLVVGSSCGKVKLIVLLFEFERRIWFLFVFLFIKWVLLIDFILINSRLFGL